MSTIKDKIENQIEIFNGTMGSFRDLWQGLKIFFWWFFPSLTIVILVDNYGAYLPSTYLNKAIDEGIGPHLWNTIGVLAFFLAGLAILFPHSRTLAKSAYQVLINTYAIGGLTLGLALGKLIAALSTLDLDEWQIWLKGIGVAILFVQALYLNFLIWYIGWLLASREHPDGFMSRLTQTSIVIRLCGFFLFSVFPVFFLLSEE